MDVISKDLLKQFVYMDSKVNLYSPDGSFEIPLSITAAKLYSPVIKAALESPLSVSSGEQEEASERKTIQYSKSNLKDNKQVSAQLSGSGGLRRIKVDDFDGPTVQLFIRCLQGQIDDAEIKPLEWKRVMDILKMFHFYEVDHMYDIFLNQARQLMNNGFIVESIYFMEMYGYQETWCVRIFELLNGSPATFNTQEWKDSILKCPVTQSQVQAMYIKRKLGYG